MDFEECLWAKNQGMLAEEIREYYEKRKPMDAALHKKAMGLYREYLIVGGMPEAVKEYTENNDMLEVASSRNPGSHHQCLRCRYVQICIQWRHNENHAIDGMIATFDIRRSLSKRGCPYDNAVAESAFKVFKTEFANQQVFPSLDYLKLMLSDYVNWYNNVRIHLSLGYLTPVAYRKSAHKKVV